MTDVTAPRQRRPRGTARRTAASRARGRATRRDGALRYCLGPGLVRAMRGATVNVERHVPELNALNVYPVPDGDTGINMIATMRAALAEVEAIPPGRATLSELATAISFGALMGARGNSGVILSQVFRGMAESVAGKRRADARDLAAALAAGSRTAYGAVARPVEGTILTVAREAADAATAAAERGDPLEVVLAVATDAARRAVERTPDQLAVLREAGVVDAGGQGLYRALEGALATLGPGSVASVDARPVPGRAAGVGSPAAAGETLGAKRPQRSGVERADGGGPTDPGEAVGAQRPERSGAERAGGRTPTIPPAGGWGYETVYLLVGNAPLEPEGLRRRLEEIGESVLVAGDERLVKVHVHNDRPDEVIAVGLALGTLSQIAVQNLDEQTRDAHREPGTPQWTPSTPSPLASAVPARPLAVLAVAAGEGLAEIFRSFGVERIVAAPYQGKPSTAELLDALRAVDAPAVIVLPNDPDVVLAAEQAARACPEKEVVVVPTRSAPEGFAALLAMDPEIEATANLTSMLAAARDVRTFLVAMADRPSRYRGRSIESGQFVVVSPDEGIVEVADDAVTAIGHVIGRSEPGFELVTLYLGQGATAAEARRVVERIAEVRPGTDVEVLDGGQPHYPYLVSVE
jgi:uncharacterized protein